MGVTDAKRSKNTKSELQLPKRNVYQTDGKICPLGRRVKEIKIHLKN
jgi:hypothetical protein